MLGNHLEVSKKLRLLAHLYYQKSWRCISSCVKSLPLPWYPCLISSARRFQSSNSKTFLWNTPLVPYLVLHNHLESAKKLRLLAHLYYQKSWRCISSFVKLPQMSRTANMGDNGWFAITHFFLSIDIQTCSLGPEYLSNNFTPSIKKLVTREN